MNQVLADIITIGDELLIGQVVDTNSSYLALSLNRIGITVRRIITVPDNEEDICNSLNESVAVADLIILTGGLGPTSDDITKSSLAKFFKSRLVTDERVLNDIQRFFLARGMMISERNRKQAEIPEVCTILRNKIGTAPGMLFRKDRKMIFSLPGVPFEMKAIAQEEVIPAIQKAYILPVKLQTTVLTTGISESYTADLIRKWEENLPAGLRFAYLPSPGILRLRLSISGNNTDQLNDQLIQKRNELAGLLGEDNVFGFDDDLLESVVGKLLRQYRQSLSLAESCTGGYLAHLITRVPGASDYFSGSITGYSNMAKNQILKVSVHDIKVNGAVSQQVVEQMAMGAKKLFDTDFSIATSGIAGPDGGTIDKPVGTAWIAIASPDAVISMKFLFGDNRERNIIRASVTALNMLRNSIGRYNKK